ncbi:hypothetical protein SAMN05192583_3493 [Sphingomonas gellani]|uniref:Uncharacterized protein n=1 Tax=Sphingomonas gellani TaxID=1166340 RepID=A0A1H8J5M8_9SPHN|nr:hypothetical protein [Sphingomonas gellani]SEN76042.1 hypothetical protein SAMN05192583_3493 [Sphingomonas gellani]
MDIVKLPVGEQAPIDVDWIRIEEQADGTYTLTASALCRGSDDGDSVSMVDGPRFSSVADAEADGFAWAESVGVERLFVSTGTLTHPLETLEIDRPL